MHADPSSPRAGTKRLFALVAAGALLVGACASNAATPAAPTTGASPAAQASASAAAPTPAPTQAGPVVLKVAATANITTWDPVKSFSTEAFYLANIYEPLLWINPPGSAEQFTPVARRPSWDVSDDGLTWTFHLRDGVTFHDGDAADRGRGRAVDRGRHGPRAARRSSGRRSTPSTAVDPLTVEMKLKYAAPMDLVASSLYGAWIVSPKALAAAAADDTYFETGIDAGTGPYTIESYTPDTEVS